jgi:glycosyltransferase involved in cell wall biosynthesis
MLDARIGRKPSGIGNYVLQLARAAGQQDPSALVPVCYRRHVRTFTRFGLRPTRVGNSLTEADLRDAAVVHGPNFHAPETARAARVATIHDLGFITLPECHPPGMPERLDRLIRDNLATTTRFICDSADTLKAFAEHYAVSEERCDLVPLGVDLERFTPESDHRRARAIRLKYRLRRPFVLFVGAMVPRKDVLTLLRAFSEIADHHPDLELVIAGHKTRRWASDWPKVKEWLGDNPGLRKRVRILNFVAAADLPELYRTSQVVALPSLTEGFGLTVLEAFASGRPVVASRAGAIPEIGVDAAYYGEPRNAASFAAALSSALTGEDAQRRRAAADTVVRAHTWERTWSLTAESYRRAIA